MNRRDFARSLAALGLAPLLPALPATAAATAPAYTPYMYGLGAHMARTSGHCSSAMLMQKLRLTPAAASALQTQLIRNGIVTAPNAAGLAAAAQPYMRATPVTQTALARVSKTARRLARRATDAGKEHLDDTPGDDNLPKLRTPQTQPSANTPDVVQNPRTNLTDLT